jgi:hypothetical protein
VNEQTIGPAETGADPARRAKELGMQEERRMHQERRRENARKEAEQREKEREEKLNLIKERMRKRKEEAVSGGETDDETLATLLIGMCLFFPIIYRLATLPKVPRFPNMGLWLSITRSLSLSLSPTLSPLFARSIDFPDLSPFGRSLHI